MPLNTSGFLKTSIPRFTCSEGDILINRYSRSSKHVMIMTLFSVQSLTDNHQASQTTQTQPISPGCFSTTSSSDASSLYAGSPVSDTSTSDASSKKPTESYIALIAKAILSVREQKMLLCDIYQNIMDIYPFYRNNDKSWRNSIRHNLSLNECFIKNGRSNDGRGNYWSIHPANLEDFVKGDFRRRKARRRVRQCYDMVNAVYCHHPFAAAAAYGPSGYVPMTASSLPYNYFSHPSFTTPMYPASPSMYSPSHQYTTPAAAVTTTPSMYSPSHQYTAPTTTSLPVSPEPVPSLSSYCSQPLPVSPPQTPSMPPMMSAASWQDTFNRLQAMK